MTAGLHNVVTYEPDNTLRRGYRTIFRDIITEVSANRWLIFQLFKRDFFVLYKQSVIGIVWVLIIPLAAAATFIFLNGAGLFDIGTITIPYALYTVLGIAVWSIFSTGLVAGTNSLVMAGSMITKINFSKKSLVIASIGQAIFSFLIQFCLVLGLLVRYRFTPSVDIVLVPLLVIPIVLLTLGLGFILSLFNAILRDVGSMLSLALTFLLFLTPIAYAKPTAGVFAIISSYNPIYYLVTVPRDLALIGTTSAWNGFVLSSALAAGIFIVSLVLFHLTETRIAERV